MDRLANALKGLFTAAADSGGDLARTASFALENVDWTGTPDRPEPATNPTVDSHLEAACTATGSQGSPSAVAAETLLTVTDRLTWRQSPDKHGSDPDMVAFSSNFTGTAIIGTAGLLRSDKVAAGISLQAPDTYYPGHVHHAEESYWIIGGRGDWKVATRPWFAVEPEHSIYHESDVRHTMQTNEQAMLAVWLWTSHLDSEVVMVRG